MSVCSISTDMKAVIAAAGVPATVYKQCSSSQYEERVLAAEQPGSQAPVSRYLESDYLVPYDSHIVVGDTFTLPDGKRFMVLAEDTEYCGGSAVDRLISCYTVNVLVAVLDYNQNPGYDTNYVRNQPWSIIANGEDIYGVLLENTRFDGIASHSQEIESELMSLYLPGCLDNSIGQRVVLSTGDKYMVETVNTFKLPGINILTLVNDTRPD